MGLDYSREKMTDALLTLAVHPGRVQDRLAAATGSDFMLAVHDSSSADYLPEQLQQQARLLLDRLSATEASRDEGSLAATASQMADPEAQQCAQLMADLAVAVIELAAEADAKEA